MRRREFIAGCCASAAWPLAARAQQHARTYRVGLLANRPIGEGEERRKAIIEVLAAHDFVEGRNLLFEPRWGDYLSENVEALKAARVDVIITFGYGRAPTFLMIIGYEQVRSIAADIYGDKEAASGVELELPETDVCTRRG